MAIQKYRIVEETSLFTDGSQRLKFALQALSASNPKQWYTLGVSSTLADARKALLFYTPVHVAGSVEGSWQHHSPEKETRAGLG